jgi:hypothetical protein
MNQDDPLLAALARLPLPEVPPALSREVERRAHAELRRVSRGTRTSRGVWLELGAATLAFCVAALHAGWAITFVAALYR